jgi:ubiquinone biosynthesis protein UbiJ
MPGDPKECRRHALSCMQISQSSASSEATEHFADLARTWLRLAGDLESGQALIDLLNEIEPDLERRAG